MKTQPQAMRQSYNRAKAFAKFLQEVPIGTPVSLYNIQGALRFAVPGIPAHQDYAIDLETAIDTGTLRQIGQDRYERIKVKWSSPIRRLVEELADRLQSARLGRVWID